MVGRAVVLKIVSNVAFAVLGITVVADDMTEVGFCEIEFKTSKSVHKNSNNP